MRRAATGVVGVLAVVLLAAGAAVGGYAVTDAVRPAPARPGASTTSPGAAPAVLGSAARRPSAAATSAGRDPSTASVAASLRTSVTAGAFGGDLHAQVSSLAGGTSLYGRGTSTPVAPASTAKLLTAAAALSVHPPDHRFTTTVRYGSKAGDVVLVGGGDPTLTAAAVGRAARYPQAARLTDLAAAIDRTGTAVRRIVVDDSLFTGPTVSPDWAAEDVPSDYGSAITAVMADGGRATPAATERSAEPDLAAGKALAGALGHPSLPVVRGRAAASSRVIGTVRSAPLSVLIAQMLQQSDNVIAECLGRQVALADHRPATFTGAAAAIRDVLRRSAHVDAGAGMVDASGLARRDRLTTTTLAAVLRATATQPRLRYVLAGLPVAGWSGSLADRYLSTTTRAGDGVVRAKTGTLTGVSALAGLVHDRSGGVLVFAFVTNKARDTPGAEAALDTLATRLAGR